MKNMQPPIPRNCMFLKLGSEEKSEKLGGEVES
jgi:hypothetical protein